MKTTFSYNDVNCVVTVAEFVYHRKDENGNKVPTTLYKYTAVNLNKELVTGITNTKLKKKDFFLQKQVKVKTKTYINVELVPKLTELTIAFNLIKSNVDEWEKYLA